MTEPILAATAWRDNAEMIWDLHRLGYIRESDAVLDPTWGRGKWWKKWQPVNLVRHDLLTLDGVDFRSLPHADGEFDVVAFDPPYVTPGGRKTSTLPDFQNAYGIDTLPKTLDETHDLIAEGIMEARRVLKPKGLLLMKCMNYVSGGKYRSVAYDLLHEATAMGFVLKDELVHLSGTGPQPKRDKQQHARRNYTHLFVLQKNVSV